jgi:hypothetical protein
MEQIFFKRFLLLLGQAEDAAAGFWEEEKSASYQSRRWIRL